MPDFLLVSNFSLQGFALKVLFYIFYSSNIEYVAKYMISIGKIFHKIHTKSNVELIIYLLNRLRRMKTLFYQTRSVLVLKNNLDHHCHIKAGYPCRLTRFLINRKLKRHA